MLVPTTNTCAVAAGAWVSANLTVPVIVPRGACCADTACASAVTASAATRRAVHLLMVFSPVVCSLQTENTRAAIACRRATFCFLGRVFCYCCLPNSAGRPSGSWVPVTRLYILYITR